MYRNNDSINETNETAMNKQHDETISDPFLALLPERVTKFPRGPFDVFPKFNISVGKIENGYDHLASLIKNGIDSGIKTIAVDGFQGARWDVFDERLRTELERLKIPFMFIPISAAYASAEVIAERISPFLGGDDPLFGVHYPLGFEIFFDAIKLSDLRISLANKRAGTSGEITIVYGPGSSLVELYDQLWYVDVPKDYLQENFRNGQTNNIGTDAKVSFGEFYKRAYFVEWPALNRLKRTLLPSLDLFIDLQDSEAPSFIEGEAFRKALLEISETPFRIRPWFYPGPWGGKFMQGHMGLDPEAPNFAWSFEMIVPENGIIMERDGTALECSFDCIMFLYNNRVLGKEASRQFKYEWPIRFDYLDTIDGGNLSVQVHPRPDYIRKNFGETYTQDETYYIVAAKPDSNVYIGLTEDCEPAEFRKALEDSIVTGKEMDVDKFVNKEPSKPHDLFLIPNGTVHCSGEGNLVLEISATPYIFTFKIYDYLRRDLEGNLRPINIERAFENIRFERRKNWVQQNLLAKKTLINKSDDWEEYVLYDAPYTFYTIKSVEFDERFETNTNGIAISTNLVQGEGVEILSENGKVTGLSYLETMIIPAATGKITVTNKGKTRCKMLIVSVRPGTGVTEPVNEPR